MLQEATESIVMERKSNLRGGQSPGRALVPDSKLRQDGSAGGSGRCYKSSGRKWEGPIPKGDSPNNKPWLHKKPYPRGSFIQDPGVKARNQVADAEEAEIGSAARPGSKKLNLNHLLNFTYDSRGSGNERHSLASHRNNRGVWTTRVHKYNKEQFLQANCQFVVEEGRDYSVHSGDPDLLVDWEWIEQVRVFSHEIPSCPICLFPPVAAKMTRCGHLYCWPCMLHYLALSDKEWRKCPICYEAVSKNHLKSVVAQAIPCYNIGDEITMVLMQRERGSVIAVPIASTKKANGQPFKINDVEQACFAKLITASSEQVLYKIIRTEEMELKSALQESIDCPEVCFIEDAIQQLKERKAKLCMTNAACVKVEECEKVVSSVVVPENLKVICYTSAFDEEERNMPSPVPLGAMQEVTKSENQAEEGPIEVREADKNASYGGSAGKDQYYFYQSADGQHIYMHALNAHMLIREYGSLDKCPEKIVAVVVEKESISMNEDLRKRLRYLAHLPLTCDFEVVELQFSKPLVSDETLNAYAEEIDKRRRKRNQRAREENKRERLLKAKENPSSGRDNKISLESLKHFPECGSFNSSTEDQSSEASMAVLYSSSLCSEGSGSSGYVGPSFASMLRDGKAKFETPPPKLSSSSNVVNQHRHYADSDSDDERMTLPTFQDSFGAAFQDAIDKLPATNSNEHEETGGRKKKGKQKRRLLFSTNVIRNK